METQTFAQQLTAARKAAGLTQEQLGEKMHMSRQGISHWETGRSLPDAETLKLLSQALNYDFITSEALVETESPVPEEQRTERPAKVLWIRRGLSIGLLLLACLAVVLLLVLLPGGEKTPAPADRAVVQIVPAQNPIEPSYDPVLGPDPWWIFRFAITEKAGVEFTVEKMTYTYTYHNGEQLVAEYSGESVAAANALGTNVVKAGQNIHISSAEPLRDFATIAIRVEGTDAKGNALSAECVLECLTPEPTPTPYVDPAATAVMTVQANVDSIAPQVMEDIGPEPVWFMWFDIYESAGVPVTLTKVVFTAEHAEGIAWQDTYDAQMITDIFGTNVIPGGSALPWTVCNGVAPLTGFTLQVEAVDANGNILTAQDSVALVRE